MKTRSVIIVLLIGITVGYIIRMIIDTDKENLPPTMLTEIDKTEAQKLVNANANLSNYIYLDDVTLNTISNLQKSNQGEGNGSILYFGADTNDGNYNWLLFNRMEGQSNSAQPNRYFQIPIDQTKVRICPPTCDIIVPLNVKPVTCQ